MERMKNATAKNEKEDPLLEMLKFWNNYQKYLFTDTKDVFSSYPGRFGQYDFTASTNVYSVYSSTQK